MSIHRSWIFDDYDDGMQLPSTPNSPQKLFVTESTKLGYFLSLSAPARDRALDHKKKKLDVASAKSNRRRSIFESVASIILDSSDELPPLATSSNSSQSSELADSPRQRYHRRGSCTKFSLEHELLENDDASFYHDDEEPKFKSFRRNETLQSDGVFEDAHMESPSQCTKLTTIDQMPVPLRKSTSCSSSFRPSIPLTPSRSHEERTSHNSKSNMARRHSMQGPNHTHKSERPSPLAKPRHLSSPPSGKKSKSPLRNKNCKTKDTAPVFSKQKFSHTLPTAPFAHDSNHSHSNQSPSRKKTNRKHNGNSRPKNSSRKSGECAPKFGTLLQRLSLQRHDSEKSYADENTNDGGSCVSTESMPQRQPRRSSISTKISVGAQMESPRQERNGLWRKCHNTLNASDHSTASRQSQSSGRPELNSSSHKRTWRSGGHKEPDASPVYPKKNLLPPKHKVTALKIPIKLPKTLLHLSGGSNHDRNVNTPTSAQSSPVRSRTEQMARRGSCGV
jgi:hypothetical protein